MKYLDIADAQKDLLMLLDEIAVSREEVMITRDGIGVAMILPFNSVKPGDNPHPLRGMPIHIPEDFDHPDPELWGSLGE